MFETYMLNDLGKEQVRYFKTKMELLVTHSENMLVDGREKAIFKSKIEEAMFYGTRAIAKNPAHHSEVLTSYIGE